MKTRAGEQALEQQFTEPDRSHHEPESLKPKSSFLFSASTLLPGHDKPHCANLCQKEPERIDGIEKTGTIRTLLNATKINVFVETKRNNEHLSQTAYLSF